MPGEKPSNIDDTFGWTEARKKEIFRSCKKLEYILKSDYRYFMDLNGYKKVMIKDLQNLKNIISDTEYTIYQINKDNDIYKNTQINYINHIINLNKNKSIYKRNLNNDLKLIDNYLKNNN